MRAVRAALLVLSTVSAGALPFLGCLGCKEEKSGVEKRAEEIAASASAEKSAQLAAASAKDPAEERYLERKKSLVQTLTDFKADEARIMNKEPTAVAGVLRKYFESGDAGEKASKELEAKRKKDGVDGYRIKKADVSQTRFPDNLENAEVEIIEETAAKGTSACLLYVQKWKYVNEKWTFAEQKSVSKVDCPQ